MMKYTILFTLLASLADAQRTTTLTSTSTLTSTVTVVSKFVCAKLVNVTGLCRRRRGLLIDEPVILSFDDELDESIDDAFQGVLHPGQFMATRTIGGEVTPLVVLPDGIEEHPEGFYRRPNSNSPETMDVIESSMLSGHKLNDLQRRMGHQARMNDDDPQSRIYFAQLASLANAIFDAIRPSTVTITTTITVTRRSSSTTFITNSFFIMGCTPIPLPFAVCPRKRSVENRLAD